MLFWFIIATVSGFRICAVAQLAVAEQGAQEDDVVASGRVQARRRPCRTPAPAASRTRSGVSLPSAPRACTVASRALLVGPQDEDGVLHAERR